MKNYTILFQWCFFLFLIIFNNIYLSAASDTIPPRHEVTLPEAHIGDLEIDKQLLDSCIPYQSRLAR